jgi:hypothetical protein
MLSRVLPLLSLPSPAWRAWLAGFLVLASLALTAPALATGLRVQSRTDFIPGVELGWMRSTFFRIEDGLVKPQNAAIDQWKHHSYASGSDWVRGVRIAEVGSLPKGLYRGQVSAYDPNGGLLVSRPVRLTLDTGNFHVVTVLLTRENPLRVGVLSAIDVSHWTSEEVDVPGDSISRRPRVRSSVLPTSR